MDNYKPLTNGIQTMVSLDVISLLDAESAVMLGQIHYWLQVKEEQKDPKYYHDGRYWIYNSFSKWCEIFPCFSEKTIKRKFKKMRDMGILLTGSYNKMNLDKTLWYSIDYDRLEELLNSNKGNSNGQEGNPRQGQNDPIDRVKVTQPIPYNHNHIINNNINGVSDDTRQIIYRPKDDVNFQVKSLDTLSTEKDTFKDSTSFSSYCVSNDSTPSGALDISYPSGMTTNIYCNIERAKIACDRLELTESQRTEILRIVKFFFETYRKYRGEEHPVLSQNLMDRAVMSIHDDDIPADSEIYTDIIENYFRSDNLKCDFHIQHFVSGDVRKFRSYECYGNMLAIYDT